MKEKIPYYRIEAFLSNALNDDEKQDFEQEMLDRPELRGIVEEQRAITFDKSYSEVFEPVSRAIVDADERSIVQKFLDLLLVPQFQLAASVSMICIIVLVVYNPQDTNEQYRAKGVSEITLLVNAQRLHENAPQLAHAGDTLKVQYRSSDALFVQVWYRDDKGALAPYISENGSAIKYGAVTSLTPFKQYIVLDDQWKEEEVYVMSASKPFTMKSINGVVAFPETGAVTVQVFTLTQKTEK